MSGKQARSEAEQAADAAWEADRGAHDDDWWFGFVAGYEARAQRED